MVVFEDQNKETVEKALQLWQSLFGNTAYIKEYKTKHGTLVFHLYANREGIVKLYKKMKLISKQRYFTDLWEKQKDLEWRYRKTKTPHALKQNETKNSYHKWEKIILEYLTLNRYMTSLKAQNTLELSKDRTRKFLKKLRKKESIYLTKIGRKSRYTLKKEDDGFNQWSKEIVSYLEKHKYTKNREVKELLGFSSSYSYKILKKMVNEKILKQTSLYRGTKYSLNKN